MSKYQSRQWGKRAFAGVPIIKEEMVTSSKDFLAQIEREARKDELNKLSLHQGTTSNGTDDIQVTLDYITKRLAELEKE